LAFVLDAPAIAEVSPAAVDDAAEVVSAALLSFFPHAASANVARARPINRVFDPFTNIVPSKGSRKIAPLIGAENCRFGG
jgi:hypothetical protein